VLASYFPALFSTTTTGAVPIAKLEDSEKFIGFTSINFHKRSNIEGRHR